MSDLLRLIVLLEASAALWITSVVLLRYRRRYLQATRSGTAGRRKTVPGRRGPEMPRRADTDWIGLLPLHVWLVTAFSMMAIVQAAAITASRLGDSLVWYGTPWSILELSLLIGALFVIAGYENRVTGR